MSFSARAGEQQLSELVIPLVESLGLEIVDLVLRRHGKRWRLRVDIDRAGPDGVRLEDCERVSTELGRLLDEHDVIPESYLLEVSSPGLDRPIRSDDDVRRNTGRRVVVEIDEPLGDRREFHGILLGAEGGDLRLGHNEGGETRIPRSRIVRAHQEIDIG